MRATRGSGTAAVGTVVPPSLLLILFSAGRHLDRPISFRPECRGALRLPVARHCRDVLFVPSCDAG